MRHAAWVGLLAALNLLSACTKADTGSSANAAAPTGWSRAPYSDEADGAQRLLARANGQAWLVSLGVDGTLSGASEGAYAHHAAIGSGAWRLAGASGDDDAVYTFVIRPQSDQDGCLYGTAGITGALWRLGVVEGSNWERLAVTSRCTTGTSIIATAGGVVGIGTGVAGLVSWRWQPGNTDLEDLPAVDASLYGTSSLPPRLAEVSGRIIVGGATVREPLRSWLLELDLTSGVWTRIAGPDGAHVEDLTSADGALVVDDPINGETWTLIDGRWQRVDQPERVAAGGVRIASGDGYLAIACGEQRQAAASTPPDPVRPVAVGDVTGLSSHVPLPAGGSCAFGSAVVAGGYLYVTGPISSASDFVWRTPLG